jgi:hypothetical protein
MTRYPDWPERLHRFIEDRREAVFCWGAHDCCLFAADALAAITGADLASDLRGKYASRLGAARLLKKHGGLRAIADARLERIPTLAAGRGDIVLIETPEGDALGVCLGRQIAAQGSEGLVFMGMERAEAAWREGACRQ